MQKQRNPDVEPSIDELVRDYMGAVPPVAAVPLATDSVAAPPTPSPVIGPEKPPPSNVVRPVDITASAQHQLRKITTILSPCRPISLSTRLVYPIPLSASSACCCWRGGAGGGRR